MKSSRLLELRKKRQQAYQVSGNKSNYILLWEDEMNSIPRAVEMGRSIVMLVVVQLERFNEINKQRLAIAQEQL